MIYIAKRPWYIHSFPTRRSSDLRSSDTRRRSTVNCTGRSRNWRSFRLFGGPPPARQAVRLRRLNVADSDQHFYETKPRERLSLAGHLGEGKARVQHNALKHGLLA